MKTDIWMPWYISDYEKDTKALSLEEDCIYRRAIDYLWQNPAGLPRDTVRLSRCLRLTEEEAKRLKWVLDEYLEVLGDKYKSERVDKEYKKALQRAEIARENGRKGGRPVTSEKPSGLAIANQAGNPSPNPDHNPEKSSSQSPSPSQSQSTTQSGIVDTSSMSTKEKENEERMEKKRQELEILKKQEQEIFDYWREKLDHPQSVLESKRSKAIRGRLKEGYSVDRIKQAIDGIKLSPHNMGVNDRNTVFDDIELICRSGSNVDRFANMLKGGGKAYGEKFKFEQRTAGIKAFVSEQSRLRDVRRGVDNSSGSLSEPGSVTREVTRDV